MATRSQWMVCVATLLAIEVHAGLDISGCENEIKEGTDPAFTCETFKDAMLQWTVFNYTDQTVMLASCNQQTCTSTTDHFNLSVGGTQSTGYTSRLTITGITRSDSRLVCNTSNARAECFLNIIAPGIVVPENCSVWIVSSNIHGACAVERMFTSSGNYSCTWLVNSDKIKGNFNQVTEYTVGNKKYWKGVCYLSMLMPLDQHIFIVNISIDPGPPNYYVGTLNITSLNISGCENEIKEGTDPAFTCGPFKDAMVQWTVYDFFGQTVILASCNQQTCTSNTDQFNLSVGGTHSTGYTSRLTIKGFTRSEGQLVCNTSNARAECILNIIAPGIVVPENCSVWIVSSHIHGACAVERMFRSSGIYSCTWLVNNQKLRGNFSQQLTEYRAGIKTYWKGVCYFSMLMPLDQHIFIVNISIDPGPPNYYVGTLNITPVASFIISTNGPSSVHISGNTEISRNGADIVLVCTAVDVYPSAVFVWNITCDDETHNDVTSTCIMSTAHVDDEMTIECKASNSVFENVSSSAVYVLNARDNIKAPSNGSVDSNPGAIIGGVIAAVVIIAAVGGAVIVYIKKRRKAPTYETTRRPANNQHIYEDLDKN